MNELQIFSKPEFGQIRTLLIDNEPWAVGKDVAEALGYTDTAQALRKHVDPEDKMGGRNDAPSMESQSATPSITDSMGRTQYPVWINESGLYSLILSSKLPNAKRFKRWVTSEVLPALRRSGSYTVKRAESERRPLTADDYLNAARILAGCRDERLPLVMPLIRQAGIDLPQIEERRKSIIVHPVDIPKLNVSVHIPPPWRAASRYTPEERERMRTEMLERYPQLAE